MNTELHIKNVGRMWRVYHGKTVLAFTNSYRHACIRAIELKATRAAERVELWRTAQ